MAVWKLDAGKLSYTDQGGTQECGSNPDNQKVLDWLFESGAAPGDIVLAERPYFIMMDCVEPQ